MNTSQRAQAISQALKAVPVLWQAAAQDLLESLSIQLGDRDILDQWIENGGQLQRASAMTPLLHIVSQNTPEAAIQSLSRGILLGAENQWIKTPRDGLPELADFLDALPSSLRRGIDCSPTLKEHWLEEARAVVAFGSDETIEEIRSTLSTSQHLQAHGHMLSCAVFFEMPGAAELKTFLQQVILYQQLGCLSPHQVYLAPELWSERQAICEQIASGFEELEQESPRPAIDDGVRTRIQHARSKLRLLAELEPSENGLWESKQSTAWTLSLNSEPLMKAGPGHRFLSISPLPDEPAQLGPELKHCSSVGIFPATESYAKKLESWKVPRICSLLQIQNPSIHWHHDGIAPLADLVTWQDIDLGS